MKTAGFSASITGGKKVFVVSLIVALIFASLLLHSVFAAPGSQGTTASEMEKEWSELLDRLQALNRHSISVRLRPSDFEKPADLERANGHAKKWWSL